MHVLITRLIPQEAVDLLERGGCTVDLRRDDRPIPRDDLLARVAGCDALYSMITDRVDAEVFDAAPRLRVVANFGVGYNNIDVAEATARGIAVSNTPDVLTETTADLAWALILAAARRLGEAERILRAGRWSGWGTMQFLGRDVHGANLGIVGAGRIGTATALRAKGFHMQVLYTHPRPNPLLEAELDARRVNLDTLLAESDIVSLHVYLDESTRHLIGADALRKMKPTAVLVNTSRGPVVDEAALAAALAAGEIAAAGLDVYEQEPKVHPALLERENVVLLPHIGSATVATRTRMATLAAENILAVKNGTRPPSVVNPVSL